MDEKESILIVDDDEGIRRILMSIFEEYGYETEEAGTGREAIEKTRERLFNLVLLDIKLPDMEGIELIAPLKARYLDMAIIMITGYASVETAAWSLRQGASAYITKPFDMEELLATIRELLEKQRLAREKREAEEALQVQRKWLESFVQYSPLGIVTVDKNAKIISCNSTFEEIFQYKESEILGRDIDELVAGKELIEEARGLSKKATIDGMPSKITTRRERKDGTWIDVEVFAVPVKIGDELVGQYGMYHDITEHKRVEKEAKKRLSQLEVYYKATIGREQRVIELKHQVNELLKQLGKEEKYGA